MELRYPQGPVVLFGASYLQGWRVDHLGGLPVVNCAKGGLTTQDLINLLTCVVVPVRPRAVVMWGFNDLLRATPETIERALEQECANLETLVAQVIEQGIEPVLMTELTWLPPQRRTESLRAVIGWLRGKQSYQDYINDRIVRLNAFIRGLAHREELLLLDVQALFSQTDAAGRLGYFKPDGHHVSASGYAAITSYAAPVLGFLFGDEDTLPAADPDEQSLPAVQWVQAPRPLVRPVRQRG